MPVLSIAETVTRPASATLDLWFPTPVSAPGAEQSLALATEQQEVAGSIASAMAQMSTELDADGLDELAERSIALFARAEELRLARSLAARAANDTWLVSIDLD